MNKESILPSGVKILGLYILVLIFFYFIQSNLNRLIGTILLFLFSNFLFKINYKLGCFYFLLGIVAAFTEFLFINYINLSWNYRNPDVFSIPFWLIPLWGIAIIFISEINIILKNYIY